MNIIWFFHFIVLILIIFGWGILPKWTLKYQMFIVPLIFLDWNDWDGMCILTRLEHYFKTGKWEQKSFEEGGPEFFRPLLEKILGKKFDRITASRINYTIFIFAWIITYFKFLKLNSIKLIK